jgi:hypothetical protein
MPLFRPPTAKQASTRAGRRPRLASIGSRRWQGPTLSEFVSRVQSEFGDLRPASDCLGLDASDRLDADSLRTLCDQWGLPAEDFGLDA